MELVYVIVFGTIIPYVMVVWAGQYLTPSINVGANIIQPISSLFTGLAVRAVTAPPHFGVEGLQFGHLGLFLSCLGLYCLLRESEDDYYEPIEEDDIDFITLKTPIVSASMEADFRRPSPTFR